MELIKRKILREKFIDRRDSSPSYGTFTADTLNVNIFLTQDIEDMGMFTPLDFIPNLANSKTPVDYSILSTKLNSLGLSFPFMQGIVPSTSESQISPYLRVTGKTDTDYYSTQHPLISGQTDSKLEDLKTYDITVPYKLNFDINSESYTNYQGNSVNGVSRITSLGNPVTYVVDTDKTDTNIGTVNQGSGLLYQDFTENPGIANVSFLGQGFNETNLSQQALIKKEVLYGIISKPEIKSDVFIDRLVTTVFEKHLKMSEITNLDELARYGRGFFNVRT